MGGSFGNSRRDERSGNGIMFKINFVKAYDCIDWDFYDLFSLRWVSVRGE